MRSINGKKEILQVLRSHKQELQDFGVHTLALFGSFARDEATQESDVDLLVEFDRPVGLFRFSQLQLRLEALLHHRVDLVTEEALRPTMRERILQEAVRV